jgi:hypothetical protein
MVAVQGSAGETGRRDRSPPHPRRARATPRAPSPSSSTAAPRRPRRGLRDRGRQRSPRDAPRRGPRLDPLGRRGRREPSPRTEGSWEVALRAKIAIHGFGAPRARTARPGCSPAWSPCTSCSPWDAAMTLGATYASRGARQNALSIDTAHPVPLPPPHRAPRQGRRRAPPRRREARRPSPARRARGKVTVGNEHRGRLPLSLPTGTDLRRGLSSSFVEHAAGVDDGFMAGTRVRVK